MEDYLREKLNTKVLTAFGRTSGGCISNGCGYRTDDGQVFVKSNSRPDADVMFAGEYRGLREIDATDTVTVPRPLLTGEADSRKFIVVEYHDVRPLNKYSANLGAALARLHLHNIQRLNVDDVDAVDKFGFHVTTCCGYLPQDNEWSRDWVSFYASQRLEPQIRMVQREKNCREITELWSELQLKLPSFFKNADVKPSLLHGDLWCGNAGDADGDAIIFDPAVFYGHHEYDLAIAGMFGGFDRDFYKGYHSLIPKEEGFERRHDLYQLFHHLNHWNHFDTHKLSTLTIMRNLLK